MRRCGAEGRKSRVRGVVAGSWVGLPQGTRGVWAGLEGRGGRGWGEGDRGRTGLMCRASVPSRAETGADVG
ncbi:hypothetical protein GCM10012275_33860 [Longimycelium tulufanense]|uniref:Uncharacterized protein n=1 Tax=Longimycelium tulufanense TaxID=907463 RepID=A0A8J3FWI0_9PSEU|nr:hypothetical protein GCM10012275_33860 [Longimycelium tulufanense]